MKGSELTDERPLYYTTTSLRFECQRCGACCRRPGYLFFSPQEVLSIQAYLNWTIDELKSVFSGPWLEQHQSNDKNAQISASSDRPLGIRVTENEPCPFLFDDRCRIQVVKPQQCRAYPFWPELVCTKRAWRAERLDCPGIGRGREFTTEEVQAILDLGLPEGFDVA